MRKQDFETTYYAAGDFSVQLCVFLDPVLGTEVTGYGVFNTNTGVREAEARRLYTAQLAADKFHEDSTVTLEEQQMELLRVVPAANDEMV